MDYPLYSGRACGPVLGGEGLVRGKCRIARRLAIPPLLIGPDGPVGFSGTPRRPNFCMSVDAALRGVPDIALGNIIGLQQSPKHPAHRRRLGAGLAITVFRSGHAAARHRGEWWRGGRAAAAVLHGPDRTAVGGDAVSRAFWAIWSGPTASRVPRPPRGERMCRRRLDAGVAVVGRRRGWRTADAGRAVCLVDGAVAIARGLRHFPEAFIGPYHRQPLGTSLPRACDLAHRRACAGSRRFAIGNIVGSNIFNVLGILGHHGGHHADPRLAPVPELRFADHDRRDGAADRPAADAAGGRARYGRDLAGGLCRLCLERAGLRRTRAPRASDDRVAHPGRDPLAQPRPVARIRSRITVTWLQARLLSELSSLRPEPARADEAEDGAFADGDVPAEDGDAPEDPPDSGKAICPDESLYKTRIVVMLSRMTMTSQHARALAALGHDARLSIFPRSGEGGRRWAEGGRHRHPPWACPPSTLAHHLSTRWSTRPCCAGQARGARCSTGSISPPCTACWAS